MRFICWIFGHDMDMTFPEDSNVDSIPWMMVCMRCGEHTNDLREAYLMGRHVLWRIMVP